MNLNNLKVGLLVTLTTIIYLTNLPVKAQNTPEAPTELKEEIEETKEIDVNIDLWRTARLIQTLRGHTGTIDALAFNPQGDVIISGGSRNDPTMKFWSVETGKEIEQIRAQRTGVMKIAVSPDGRTLVSTGEDAGVNMWNWETGQFLASFFVHSNNILAMVISPDSRIMVSGGLDGIRVWNLTPQRPVFILDGVGNPTYSLAIHPNGYIIASGHEDGRVRFWNLRTAQKLSEFSLHDDIVSGVAFSPDGNKLVTASYDGTIKVWDLVKRELLYTLKGDLGRIRSIALSPDGKTLASAGNGGVRIWNIDTGEFVASLSGHTDWVQSLAFSRDGKRLATGGFDRLIRVWEINDTVATSPGK
jgi:WD40 repeat protein